MSQTKIVPADLNFTCQDFFVRSLKIVLIFRVRLLGVQSSCSKHRGWAVGKEDKDL